MRTVVPPAVTHPIFVKVQKKALTATGLTVNQGLFASKQLPIHNQTWLMSRFGPTGKVFLYAKGSHCHIGAIADAINIAAFRMDSRLIAICCFAPSDYREMGRKSRSIFVCAESHAHCGKFMKMKGRMKDIMSGCAMGACAVRRARL